jgi:serine phosphatase RsbU (regulator of sigma subunit)
MAIFRRIRNKVGLTAVLVSIIPMLVFGLYAYDKISKYLRQTAIRNVGESLSQIRGRIEIVFTILRDDVFYLSRLPSVRALVAARAASDQEAIAAARKEVANDFRAYAAHHSEYADYYYQLRYIDERGREVVRVENSDGKIVTVPDDELQDKSDSYYVKEAIALKEGQLYISPLDLNREGGVIEEPPTPVIRYATPVFDDEGTNRGIVIINVFGGSFLKIVDEARQQIPEGVLLFMVDGEGYFVSVRTQPLLWGSPRDLGTGENFKRIFHPLAEETLNGEGGFVDLYHDAIVSYQPVFPNPDDMSNRFVLFCFHPNAVIFGPLYTFQKFFIMMLVVTLAAAVFFSFVVASRLTRPLKTLEAGAERVGRGELDQKIIVHSNDETASVAASFNTMTERLKQYIHDLRETTAAKERTESELRVAHAIQQKILPQEYPPFPDIQQIDVYAKNLPARQVGGDFYDFYRLDEHRVLFSLGDVSGKGVPAALLMGTVVTLFKVLSKNYASPSMILREANSVLLRQQEEGNFVSAFLGVLNLDTMKLTYANAGHNPPLLLRKDNALSELSCIDMLMAVEDELMPEECVIKMNPGERLIVYSDGLNEAMSAQGEMFGLERLQEAIKRRASSKVQELGEGLIHDVLDFQKGGPQSDDVTLLIVQTG